MVVGPHINLFIVAEGVIFQVTDNFKVVLTSLISSYFTFNIQYVSLQSILIYLQHFIFNIVDGQTVPRIVTTTISSMDNL